MNMETLAKQSLETAMAITGTDLKDDRTLELAFKFACYAMAQERLKKITNQKGASQPQSTKG